MNDELAKETLVRVLAMIAKSPEFEPIMACLNCGHEAPFALMRPANCYPGNVRCPECGSDKTARKFNTPSSVRRTAARRAQHRPRRTPCA